MGVAPIMVIFGAIYHWYPKITGRMLDETMGRFHFWVTFVGAYAIFFPMHYVGLVGVPRRYVELGETAFVTTPVDGLNAFISDRRARRRLRRRSCSCSTSSGASATAATPAATPGAATSLEWQTPETPPGHGNWGRELPIVYRWAYDYSVPGAPQDFIAQDDPWPNPPAHGMSVIIVFILVVIGFSTWWLLRHGLMTKPWLEVGADPVDGGRERHADREDRARRLPRRGRRALRALRQRLLHAPGVRRLAGDAAAADRLARTPACWSSPASRCSARSPRSARATPTPCGSASSPARSPRSASSPASSSPGASSPAAATR